MSDLASYMTALRNNHVDVCLLIEERHELDGYPPSIVIGALRAIENGEDVDEWLDRNTSPTT